MGSSKSGPPPRRPAKRATAGKREVEQNKVVPPAPSRHRSKVLVVDDHPVVRQGLVMMINNQSDLEVCGEAATAEAAFQTIADKRPDAAIVDLSLKDTTGLELMKDIKIRFPQLPVLVLSMHDEAIYAERALRAGARGYVMKEESAETILSAIRQVLAGKIYLSSRMTSRLLDMMAGGGAPAESPLKRLSDRELQVFQLIGRGLGTNEIAQQLHLSIKTVESYRAHLKEKLSLASATELQYYAIRWAQQDPTS